MSFYKKEKIPSAVRNTVWLKWVNDKNNAKCYCCKLESITTANWHCGHVVSERNGGAVHLNNLRPICAGCNSSMGKMNMYDFIKKYGFDTIGDGIDNDDFLKKSESIKKPSKKPSKKPNKNLSTITQLQKKYDALKNDYDKLKKKFASLEKENKERLSEDEENLTKRFSVFDENDIEIEHIDIKNPISVFNYGIKHKFDAAFPVATYTTGDNDEKIESKEKFVIILKHYYKRNNENEYKKYILDNYKNMKLLRFDSFDKIYGYVRTMTEFMRGFGECKCFDLTIELCKKIKITSKNIYLVNDNARMTIKDSFQLKFKTRKIYDYQGANAETGGRNMVLRDSFQLKYIHKGDFLKALTTTGAKMWIKNVLMDGKPKTSIKKMTTQIQTLSSLEIVEMLRKQQLK